MTDHDKGGDATKKRLADERSAREKKQAEQRDAMAGVKPTPTQEENDLAASGEHVTEHEAGWLAARSECRRSLRRPARATPRGSLRPSRRSNAATIQPEQRHLQRSMNERSQLAGAYRQPVRAPG